MCPVLVFGDYKTQHSIKIDGTKITYKGRCRTTV